MDGSPVLGPDRRRDAVLLFQVRDLNGFQTGLQRLIRENLQHSDVFVALADIESKQIQFPAWLKSHLQRHPGLTLKLERGDLVGISHIEENPSPRPVAAARSSVVLIPIIAESVLYGIAGIISALDAPQPSNEEIETIRHICHYYAAPAIAHICEVETLVRKHRQETEALQATVRMRSHLQHNVAHELRTPLAAIRGYARMILDGRAGEINGTQREYLTVVTDNTNRLINLVSWMSHITELTTQHLKLSTFDLRDVWAECLRLQEPRLAEKSIKVNQQIPEESFVIIGDKEKLGYVFNHLITLAVAFMNNEEIIRAELSHGRDREVCVKIFSSGMGIPQEMLHRIFERSFNAIPAAPATNWEATAVTLSGVYDIVGMHGGRVFVNSKAGEGSTFVFTLPAVKSDGEEKLTHEQAINFSSRRR